MKFTVGVVAQAALLLLLLLLLLHLHLLLLLLPAPDAAPALDCVARSDVRIFCGPLVARARRTSLLLPPGYFVIAAPSPLVAPPTIWAACAQAPVVDATRVQAAL